MACSCGFLGYPEGIAAADIAFIGTVVGANEPDSLGPDGFARAEYAFDVERSASPIETPFRLQSWFGNEAGCGLDMAVGERWLVLASMESGAPMTDLCTGTTRHDALDEATLANVEPLLQVEPTPAESGSGAGDGLRLPTGPVLGIVGAIVLVGAVSVVAFRRPKG
jgi:hypothetical protein